MKKIKRYHFVKYPPEIIDNVLNGYFSKEEIEMVQGGFKIGYQDEDLFFDNINEFYSEYRKNISDAFLYIKSKVNDSQFYLEFRNKNTTISYQNIQRTFIEELFEIFESNYEKYRIDRDELKKELKKNLKIFIGHGHNEQWRDLKDHLKDKHGFNVIAYEVGVRAGNTIIEVLKEMIIETSLAFLVLTGEDKDDNGKLRARENVIHETGLCQGKLGFDKSIIILEDGCNEFTNIIGTQQLRFSKNNIKEIYGEVIAIINKEIEKKINSND